MKVGPYPAVLVSITTSIISTRCNNVFGSASSCSVLTLLPALRLPAYWLLLCVCVVAAGPVFDGNLLRSASDSTSA